LAGVQPDPTARLRLYSLASVVLNGTSVVNGVQPFSVGNTEIRPERSAELEGGFDVELFDSRASFTFTAYHKKRLNAIVPNYVAPSAGGGAQSVNVGAVTSGGIEMTASVRLIDNPAAQWSMNLSAASSHSALTSLGNSSFASPGGYNSRLVIGYPLDGIWVRRLSGYADADGDGIIESNELVFSDSLAYVGSQDPNYTGTVSSTVAFLNGRLSFNGSIAYTNGLTQYNALSMPLLQSTVSQFSPSLEQEAVYLAALKQGLYADAMYQNVNTLRLQSASVSCVLPVSVARMFHASSASLSLQGSNLWLHTNYRGKDPNVNNITSGEGVADYGQIPEPRYWTLSLRLN
jgi:hypothetical protein